MQKITVIGRLGRDAQVRETQNRERFLAFTVAVNSKIRQAEKTTWYDVISFDSRTVDGKMKDYLKKGSNVAVVGDLDASVQQGTDGVYRLRLSIAADSINFVNTGTSGTTQNNAETTEAPADNAQADAPADDAPVAPKKKSPAKAAPKAEPEPEQPEDDLPF